MRHVRGLLHIVMKVVADLRWSMEGSALFFYIYNKVSTDFANWMKKITNNIFINF